MLGFKLSKKAINNILFYILFFGAIGVFVWQYWDDAQRYSEGLQNFAEFGIISSNLQFNKCSSQSLPSQINPKFVYKDISLFLQPKKIIINKPQECLEVSVSVSGKPRLLEKIYSFRLDYDFVLLGVYQNGKLVQLNAMVFPSKTLGLYNLFEYKKETYLVYDIREQGTVNYLIGVRIYKDKADMYLVMIDPSGKLRRAYVGRYLGALECDVKEGNKCIDYILNNSEIIRAKFLQLTKFIE